MKQHITVEQLHELSEKGREKLKIWKRKEGDKIAICENSYCRHKDTLCLEEKYYVYDSEWGYPDSKKWYPLPSIGQMIELLIENSMGNYDLQIIINEVGSSIWKGFGNVDRKKLNTSEDGVAELCDALWEAVKEVLEK